VVEKVAWGCAMGGGNVVLWGWCRTVVGSGEIYWRGRYDTYAHFVGEINKILQDFFFKNYVKKGLGFKIDRNCDKLEVSISGI
jgi:hypothetical protein